MKILIEIPHTGMFPYQFVNSYPLMLATTMKSGIGIEYELRGHSLVYEAREQAAKHFLESDCDYLLFLDSDMVPPADMLVKLIQHENLLFQHWLSAECQTMNLAYSRTIWNFTLTIQRV